jgi:chromosome segregation and condensation protein ScpB
MARKEMSKIVADAKKRRAKLLLEFKMAELKEPGITLRKFAKPYKITGERMGQHLKKAREDEATALKVGVRGLT